MRLSISVICQSSSMMLAASRATSSPAIASPGR
jgi:hypothetical protein